MQKEAISTEEFSMLRQALPAITPQHLSDTYRISETTWRKLREGIPVKRTTLERVRACYRALPLRESGLLYFGSAK